MEFSSHSQIILEALAFILLYSLWRTATKNRKSNKIRAPEPSGALPLIGHLHLLGGQGPACKILGAIADKYGPIYSLRLGIRRILVVSSWEIAKDCFTTNDRILATRASIVAGKYIGYNNAIMALAPYGQYWRDVRKMATLQLLSNQRLEMLKHVRLSEVDTFIKDLHNLCAKNMGHPAKVVISKLLEGLTFNISLRMIVGKRFSNDMYGEKNSEPWRYKKAIKEALYLTGIFPMSDAIPWVEWVDCDVSAMKRTAKELDAVIVTWLEEHMRKRLEGENNNHESDFMDVMMSNLAEGSATSGHSRDVVIKATTLVRLLFNI